MKTTGTLAIMLIRAHHKVLSRK